MLDLFTRRRGRDVLVWRPTGPAPRLVAIPVGSTEPVAPQMLEPEEVESLLSRLSIEFGFCLEPADNRRLQRKPPSDVKSFTDAVFTADGLDPVTADRVLYKHVYQLVRDAFDGR